MDSCYVQSCRAFVVTDTGQIRDRYGIAPGVTQTNKQTNTQTPNERAWKLRALRYALLPSSSCMLLELMEMLFPLISYIIVLQKRFNEILKYK